MFLFRYIIFTLFISTFTVNYSYSNNTEYDNWLLSLKADALKRGISIDTFDRAMREVVIIPKVKKLDKKQPESQITFNHYYKRTVNNNRVILGKKKYELYKDDLLEIAAVYNVQPRFILAIWGIETNYGTYTGSFSVISSLTTLAFQGRRSKFFRKQLLDAIEIVDKKYIELENMKGSWAGAMGQSQFMPSSYLTYAQDFDKDGKKDIWSNHLDVFASIANYLKAHGWDYSRTWGREVLVPKTLYKSFKNNKNSLKSLKYWSDNNIVNINGKKLPYLNYKANLLFPDGPDGKAFLVYHNFFKIKKYNASNYYALSVGLLSDRIKY
ncbi:MAG TPA: lytic murein transglycosylase [Alphaproteobacteria bacterium]|jgi:membrane-bound lytic murein transglycosylase B|nr:lytic murein transglycosylase [Alphaproteobacteria bacterium]